MSILSKPYFHDEQAAFDKLESIVWPDGPTCPKCGAIDRINRLEGVKDKKGRARPGLWKCYHCRSQFTVRVGTVFESSHVPLYKWLQAVFLMVSSKKGISANQLSRTLEVTVKTGWFMAHRIREAMRNGDFSPLGGEGSNVEVDETFIGNKYERKATVRMDGKVGKARGVDHKHVVLSLVERGGEVRSFHIDKANAKTIAPVVAKNVSRESRLQTDSAAYYRNIGKEFKGGHGTTNHGIGEYVRGNDYSNTVEGYFSIFKRGMKGVYQHCSEKHLHRYLAEFDFRYNNRASLGISDSERSDNLLAGIVGKRIIYKSGIC